MTADRLIRVATAGAVLLVAAIAAVVSFVHIEHLAVTHGQTALAWCLLPVSIDGMVAAASLVMLRAARSGLGTPWLARSMLGLAVSATLACNVGYGLPVGVPGALPSGWPAVVFIGCAEMAIGMVHCARPLPPAGQPGTAVAHGGTSAEEAARLAWRASIAAGNPLSQRQLASRFGMTRPAAARLHKEVIAESNGHA